MNLDGAKKKFDLSFDRFFLKPIFLFFLFCLGLLPTGVRAASSWYDGGIQYSAITNCVSIIQGVPYVESGAGTYVGFLADPNAAIPAPNTPYYVHIVVAGLGNSCSGMRANIDLSLPASTTLAISGAHPVYCLYDGVQLPASECPQVLPSSSWNPGAYSIPSIDSAHANTWPIPQGKILEIQIPVSSSVQLNNSALMASVWMLDGNSSPWLHPTQGVYVFSSNPTIVYPSPSTSAITSSSAHSQAYLYAYNKTGTGYFDLGTTTSYGLIHESFPIGTPGPAWLVWDDWGPPALAPDTLYHWRVKFVTDAPNSQTYYGADQTFRTLPDGRVTIGTGAASSCTDAALSSALATAKEIVFNCGTAPTTIALTSARTISSNVVIDGDNKVTLDGGAAHRFFDVLAPAQLTLKNITLANGLNGSGCGGAIRVASGSKLTLSHARLQSNHSNSTGGAICNQGTADMTSVLFKDNSAATHGGAIQSSGLLTIAASRFESNSSNLNGGGIDMGGTVVLSDTAFIGNSAGLRGGGVNSYYGGLTLSGGYFDANSAGLYGGGLSSDASTSYLENATFSGNHTPGTGGAMERSGTGTLTAVNCTISGNSAGTRGGNINTGTGVADPSIILKNSIVSAGTPDNCDFAIASQGHNLESTNACGFVVVGDIVNADPKLGLLQDNGGNVSTKTLALLAGSPAVDTGGISGCPTTDQRGNPRPLDGDGNGSAICDIGAYERVFAGTEIIATDPTATEAGLTTGKFSITRSGNIGVDLTVTYAVSGTATLNTDYALSPGAVGSVTIPAGTSSVEITVSPVDDSAIEDPETVILSLLGGPDYTVGISSSATVTITSDDTLSSTPQPTPTPQGTPTPSGITLIDALDLVQIAQPGWQSGGASSWIGQAAVSHDGIDAAQAGAIKSKQTSWLKTTVKGPGKVTFWWRNSSAKADKLNFYIGKDLKAARGGGGAWQKRTFKFSKGRKVLTWEFKRGAKALALSGAAFVDQVIIGK